MSDAERRIQELETVVDELNDRLALAHADREALVQAIEGHLTNCHCKEWNDCWSECGEAGLHNLRMAIYHPDGTLKDHPASALRERQGEKEANERMAQELGWPGYSQGGNPVSYIYDHVTELLSQKDHECSQRIDSWTWAQSKKIDELQAALTASAQRVEELKERGYRLLHEISTDGDVDAACRHLDEAIKREA